MRRAKVSELKARLSGYLADVRGGESILVCDRNTPIAREPTRPLAELGRLKGVRPKRRIDVERLLRDDRDQR
jgi:antitoxin (DNA-binding transcriptional repressor) of toxin-antitoxin stability system